MRVMFRCMAFREARIESRVIPFPIALTRVPQRLVLKLHWKRISLCRLESRRDILPKENVGISTYPAVVYVNYTSITKRYFDCRMAGLYLRPKFRGMSSPCRGQDQKPCWDFHIPKHAS